MNSFLLNALLFMAFVESIELLDFVYVKYLYVWILEIMFSLHNYNNYVFFCDRYILILTYSRHTLWFVNVF